MEFFAHDILERQALAAEVGQKKRDLIVVTLVSERRVVCRPSAHSGRTSAIMANGYTTGMPISRMTKTSGTCESAPQPGQHRPRELWLMHPRRSDMTACIVGGAQDVSFVIDFLGAYLFPQGDRTIDEFIATGISLGGKRPNPHEQAFAD